MKTEIRTQGMTAEAARLLTSARTRRTLGAFLEPRRLGEAATLLGQPLNTVKYHLKRLVAAGLLEPTPEDARRFQVVQESFFVPYTICLPLGRKNSSSCCIRNGKDA